jgi:TM2 domain-containing membrane protein YozV
MATTAGRITNKEAIMENMRENAQEPGRDPAQPQYVPLGSPRRELLRADSRYKSPVLAALMSVVPGLGQIYVGYYQQGFINIVVIAGIICMLSYYGISPHIKPFLAIFMIFYWLYNLVDAYRKATFYNQALAGLGAFELPEGEHLPGARGSLFGGVVLLIVGVIALSYTLFDLPMDWLEHWWPMALIIMGVYLLYQSFSYNRRQRKG